MKINITTNISSEYQDIDICVNAPEMTEKLEQIVSTLMQMDTEKKQIIGIKEDKHYLLPVGEIISFYSEEKSNYCKTVNGVFKVKEKLYELENTLNKDFVRISNSCIINLDYVECFYTSFSGMIEVILKDNTKEYIARRRVSEVIKKIKERVVN